MSPGYEFSTVVEGDTDEHVKKLTKEQLKTMGKIIFGIFAHPDDEAFCVAGTLLKEVSDGSEVHLVCLTDGDGQHSMNPDNVPSLGETRRKEWLEAGKLIGVTKQHHFEYADGQLCNDSHLEITKKIEDLVKNTIGTQSDKQVEFLTLDTNGMTGHIDHIVASRSALLAYYRLKKDGFPVSRVRLACVTTDDTPDINTEFALREPGRTMTEIDETIDVRDRIDDIQKIMQAHHSQRSDANAWIEKFGDKIAINHFIVRR